MTAPITHIVTVHGGTRYAIDGEVGKALSLAPGTHVFDLSATAVAIHPFRFSTTPDGTHDGGTPFLSGFSTQGTQGAAGGDAKLIIDSSTPNLYYYCAAHSGMGGSASMNRSGAVSHYPPSPPSQPDSTCEAAAVFGAAKCYARYKAGSGPIAYQPSTSRYQTERDLSANFRLSWTAYRGEDGFVDVMLQARTAGWVGFGLMSSGVAQGMLESDMWWGRVDAGTVAIYDSYAQAIAPPLWDSQTAPHTDDLYDIGGEERVEDGQALTMLRFKRRLVTNDSWDRPIVPGRLPVVYAYNQRGEDDWALYHGPSRGFAEVALLPELRACAAADFASVVASCRDGSTQRQITLRYAVADARVRDCTGGWPAGVTADGKGFTHCDYAPRNAPITIAVQAVGGVAIAIKCVLLVLLVRRRRQRVVKRAMPGLSAVAVVGAAMLDAAVFVLAGPPTTELCALRPMWLSLSATLALGPLGLKTYRVYRIFHTRNPRVVAMPERHMLVCLGLLVALDGGLIAAVLGRVSSAPRTEWHIEHSVVAFERTVCPSEPVRYVMIVQVCLLGCLAALTLLMALLTRNVFSEFNESRQTMRALLLSLVLLALIVPSGYALEQPTLTYAIGCVAICLASTLAMLDLLLPRLVHIFHRPLVSYDQTRWERTAGLKRDLSPAEIGEMGVEAKEELIAVQQDMLRKLTIEAYGLRKTVEQLKGREANAEGEGGVLFGRGSAAASAGSRGSAAETRASHSRMSRLAATTPVLVGAQMSESV